MFQYPKQNIELSGFIKTSVPVLLPPENPEPITKLGSIVPSDNNLAIRLDGVPLKLSNNPVITIDPLESTLDP